MFMCRLHFSLYIFSKLKTGTLFCVILSPFHTVPGIRGCILVVLRKLWIVPNVHPGYKHSPRSKVDPQASNISVKQNNRYFTIQGRNLDKYSSIWLNIQFIAWRFITVSAAYVESLKQVQLVFYMENGVPAVHHVKVIIRVHALGGIRYLELYLSYQKIIHVTSSPGLITAYIFNI